MMGLFDLEIVLVIKYNFVIIGHLSFSTHYVYFIYVYNVLPQPLYQQARVLEGDC